MLFFVHELFDGVEDLYLVLNLIICGRKTNSAPWILEKNQFDLVVTIENTLLVVFLLVKQLYSEI